MKLKSPFIIYLLEILSLEMLCRYVMFPKFLNPNIIYMCLYSIPVALILTILTKIFPSKGNKVISIIFVILLSIYFEFQFIFYRLFSVPFSFNTLELANQALDFVNIIKDALIDNVIMVLVLLVPLVIGIILVVKLVDYKRINKYQVVSYMLLITAMISTTYGILFINKDEYNSPYNLYYKVDDQLAIIDQFGLLTYTKIDFKRSFFGFEISTLEIEEQPIENQTPTEEEIKYGNNELNIDFDSISENTNNKTIISMNEYFKNSQSTNKNQYTGMFKGKNLVFILAEGFNEVAVDENRTPTLYKLIHEGFNFTNFYSPVFLSTTGGEFQATTGLVPTQEILKSWKSKEPTIAYALGNSFTNVGYNARAYHDWTYTYYKRNVTMKTLGYENYVGCGNGMEKLLKCNWLPSDVEMINKTVTDYATSTPFVTYYVTVSGHSPYARGANIVNKHYDKVSDLKMSANIKNYLSSQIELDLAVEELINQLAAAGTLDDTVIALVGDHYPYTLSAEEISEAATYKKDGIVEVNHSNFIIWNNGMTPVTVEKTGSQIDVLPTLLNLFGIEYDSRVIIGKDILSDYEGLAIFSNRSWVTDKGTYFSSQRKFVAKEGEEVDQEYINRINKRVSNAFSMSKMIIDNDYYTKIKE